MDSRNEVRKQYRMNPEAYLTMGKAWIATKGGFVMGLEEGECQGVKFPQAPRQWGAWRAYYRERGIKTTFMDAKALATAANKLAVNPHCWTVPTEWPHEFDSEATVQGDHEAGNWFMRNWRPPDPKLADAAQRAITAAKYKKWATETLRDKLPDVPPDEPKGKFIDVEQLLKDYEKDMAEQRAKSRKYQEAAE
jgi:hypothetical protein